MENKGGIILLVVYVGRIIDNIIQKQKDRAKDKKTLKMINDKDFSFLLDLDNEELALLCSKYAFVDLVEQLLKIDFNKGESLIEYIVNNDVDNPYKNNFFTNLLETDCHKIMWYIQFKEKNTTYLDKIINLGDAEKNANLFIEKLYVPSIYTMKENNILYKTFLYTLSFIKKDPKTVFINYKKFMTLEEMSQEQIDIVIDNIKDLQIDKFSRQALFDKRILSLQVKENDVDFILKLLNSITYDENDEIELLAKMNSNSKTIEEEILRMNNSNISITKFSLYQIVLVEMYIRKKLFQNGIEPVLVDLLSNTDSKGICFYNNDEKRYEVEINRYQFDEKTIEELINVIAHENGHIMHIHRRVNMDIMGDMDIDLYSKDFFIRGIANDAFASEGYYLDNYYCYSDEYLAEVESYHEKEKVINEKNICYQEIKSNLRNMKNTRYFWDSERFFFSKESKHINDLFEEQLDKLIKQKNGEIEKYVAEMKKETPILLLEYDINKKEIPRRRSVDELLEIIFHSNDKKIKQVCTCLLINRFNEYKEKKEDVENNIKHVKKLIRNKEIDVDLADLLLNSVKKSPLIQEHKIKI